MHRQFSQEIIIWGRDDGDTSTLRVVDCVFIGKDDADDELDCIDIYSGDDNHIEIVNSHFENCKANCIDFTDDCGSNVIIYGSAFVGCGAAALSMAEGSVYTILETIIYDATDAGVDLDDSGYGMLVLDRSTVKCANNHTVLFLSPHWFALSLSSVNNCTCSLIIQLW